jgi:hypothetical protein
MKRRELVASLDAAGSAAVVVVADASAAGAGALGPAAPGAGVGWASLEDVALLGVAAAGSAELLGAVTPVAEAEVVAAGSAELVGTVLPVAEAEVAAAVGVPEGMELEPAAGAGLHWLLGGAGAFLSETYVTLFIKTVVSLMVVPGWRVWFVVESIKFLITAVVSVELATAVGTAGAAVSWRFS